MFKLNTMTEQKRIEPRMIDVLRRKPVHDSDLRGANMLEKDFADLGSVDRIPAINRVMREDARSNGTW